MVKTYNITTIQMYEEVDAAIEAAGEVSLHVSSTYPTEDEFKCIVHVKDGAGLHKVGFKSTYDKAHGVLLIENDGAATLVTGDEIYISGVFMKGV